ncbi:Toll-like receptor 2 type-1 [Tauraco erythrolophus]|uniref:Toll-like receptor 2 type-1 n=1 Tax=Tauraco erythrolophus TaxID=121530 RepID=A0A093C7C7_TAUER|nr:PREDICTED: toll-like receptor 2 [Tauraco erythrolophus]KFV10328.1 Toll-like receptor 2 type-1 [Tauraco erythrolophus]
MRILIGSLHFYFISFLFSRTNGFLTLRTPTAHAFPFYNYSYLNLSSVSEAQAPKRARALNFSHNVIEKITQRDLEGFDTLEVLDLSYNRIKDVEPGAFERLLSLVSLNLSFNDKKLLVLGLPPHLKLLPTSEASGSLQLYKYFDESSEAAPEPSASAEELPHSRGSSVLQNINLRLRRSTENLQRAEKNVTVSPTTTLKSNFCRAPINGILDLSNRKLSEAELGLKLDPDHCQAQLDGILELDISHSDLEMDLLSLFILFLPMTNLQSVDASSNKITINTQDVEAICKFPFSKLVFLNISNNPINSLDTLCLPSTIKVIDLSFTNISQIPQNFAKKMMNLENMYVHGNHFIYTVRPAITNAPAKPPSGGVHINAISFVRNQAGTPIESLPKKVKRLEASNCSIVELPEWFAGRMEELLFLDLSSNRISVLPDLPTSLQHLDISNSDIKIIPPRFKSLCNLTIFTIQNNKITDMHPEYFPLTLTRCDISKNKLNTLSLTDTLEKLEYLNVSGNLISRLEAASHLSALAILDSSHNLISELPDHFGKSLPALKYFNLSGNKISFLQRGSLPASLTELDISDNAITTIVEDTFGQLTSLSVLTVQGKHFFCNCDLYWFVNVYIRNPRLRINGKGNLRCSFPPDRRGSLVESSNLTLLRCSLGIQMAITACVAILVVLVLTGLCWRFDGLWYVRMGWYWCMAKRKQYEKRPENKPFDAFVSYSEQDANWTKENLLQKLETDGFKICYHERDFKPGHPVLGNIFYCIENSHKVLFVLSPSFVNSCWCQYELYFAEHRVLNENQDSLIMIVLEDLPPNSVPQKFSKLRKLLKRKTYLRWSPEEHKQKMFWRQLAAVLKTTNEPLVRAENGPAQDTYEME